MSSRRPLEEEMACLQVMPTEIPKHKGTDQLQADLKAKLAKVKLEMATEKSGGKKGGRGFRMPRQGAGTGFCWAGPMPARAS